jgi:hypothetical protein
LFGLRLLVFFVLCFALGHLLFLLFDSPLDSQFARLLFFLFCEFYLLRRSFGFRFVADFDMRSSDRSYYDLFFVVIVYCKTECLRVTERADTVFLVCVCLAYNVPAAFFDALLGA